MSSTRSGRGRSNKSRQPRNGTPAPSEQQPDGPVQNSDVGPSTSENDNSIPLPAPPSSQPVDGGLASEEVTQDIGNHSRHSRAGYQHRPWSHEPSVSSGSNNYPKTEIEELADIGRAGHLIPFDREGIASFLSECREWLAGLNITSPFAKPWKAWGRIPLGVKIGHYLDVEIGGRIKIKPVSADHVKPANVEETIESYHRRNSNNSGNLSGNSVSETVTDPSTPLETSRKDESISQVDADRVTNRDQNNTYTTRAGRIIRPKRQSLYEYNIASLFVDEPDRPLLRHGKSSIPIVQAK